MAANDEISRRLALIFQIEVLKRNLEESEKSWAEAKLTFVPNVVADSIRRDIAEKEAMLAQISN